MLSENKNHEKDCAKEVLSCDIFGYVDSHAARIRLIMQNHSFDTEQAIYVVWRCRWASLAEKCGMWQRISEIMPDCECEIYGEKYESIFDLLDLHKDGLLLDVESFFNAERLPSAPDSTIYTACVHKKNAEKFSRIKKKFLTLEDCLLGLCGRGVIREMSGGAISAWREALTSKEKLLSLYKSYGRFITDRRYDRIIIKKTTLCEEWAALEIFPRGDAAISTGTHSGFEARSLLDIYLSSPEVAEKYKNLI